MSYQVLARKWRPRAFENLVGQEHVLRVLTQALDRNRIHHAYLFAGTRGVGKTTLARIFAKCLNCEVALSSKPCGHCATCRAMDAGQFLDLYEIDAASRTKVEDTRELLENIAYPPVQGRYKVYLIDEVHMLSGHSFNALLKTLEEPPPQVVFLFATTEPKRLPITILSRCLQFHLRPIHPEQMLTQLQTICESEQVKWEPEALKQLMRAADGSLRDALSLLDQAIVYCQGNLSYEELNQMLGFITPKEAGDLLKALASKDAPKLFALLAEIQKQAPDYQQVLSELILNLHQAAVYQVLQTQQPNELIQELARLFSAEELQLYYQIALLGQKDLPLSPTPAQGFEMLMLRMLAFKPIMGEKVQAPVTVTTKKNETMAAPVLPAQAERHASVNWRDLLPQLGLTGLAQALALNCKLESIDDQGVKLCLAQGYKPMMNPKQIERLEQALSTHFARPLRVTIRITEEEVQTPAKQMEGEEKNRRMAALDAMQQSSGLQKIKTLFNATLDPQSLEVKG